MKTLFAFVLVILALVSVPAQNEQAPLVEKEFAYNNWKLKNVNGGGETDLRHFAAGKKLVMVVYFAPWCPNWKHDAPILSRLYEKYHSAGLDIIAVGEYDPVETMRANLTALKIPFSAVYESESRDDREKTYHAQVRRQTGDTRKWGSPYYVFIEPARASAKGDVLQSRSFVVNGELIESEGEKFIREKLGTAAGAEFSASAGATACDEEKQPASKLKIP
jgi:thiol-disulfide isomerase/thioredoxin